MLRVVRGEQDRVAAAGQTAHGGEHAQLIAVVKARRGLIHEQQLRLLHERAGDKHHLLLAAGKPAVVPLRQMLDTERAKRLHGVVILAFSGRGNRGEPVRRSHEHHFQNTVLKCGIMDLRNIGDAVGELAR